MTKIISVQSIGSGGSGSGGAPCKHKDLVQVFNSKTKVYEKINVICGTILGRKKTPYKSIRLLEPNIFEENMNSTVQRISGGVVYTEFSNPKDLIGVKKPQIGLIPPSALILESEAFKDGAKKYGAYNFRKTKVKATVYIDAALRHLLSYLDGEEITRDSGVDHRAAVRACMAILIDAEQTGNLIDDRPSKGTSGDLIEKLSTGVS